MPISNSRGIKLKNAFRNERKNERTSQRLGWQSLYFQPFIAQLLFKLECQQGIFSYSNDKTKALQGRYLYVRTLDGHLLAAKEGEVGHHSYLSNGKKVLSAGHLIFDQGRLCLFSNESGHYTPTREEMASEITFFHHLAQNQDLIYEDHSSYPQTGKVIQYKTQSLIDSGSMIRTSPLAVLSTTLSNFGRSLKSSPAANSKPIEQAPASGSGYLTDESFLPLPRDSHYLDDECLIKEDSYEEPSASLDKTQPANEPRPAYGFFVQIEDRKNKIDCLASPAPDRPK
ncbi:hypothetical protein DIZ81_13175 [Legionella taurinensis]|uniref:Uncharacterized protein n=1 Tax=Legionella taurinensis TaxID=70611 RepID=A0A3A5L6W6_9GAMM|nr:hypothetical protein [Legionella taurinensis]MDX1836018.1 hypothetical protein [Legionella taurinensis]PUT38724.1 hypothetical protein DB744_13185 [Legionella taurinensis]PUT40103.1 hypothetical protein DB746_12585 [Legionella taurinensis]PUT42255.1 hypothetical protein DB743_13070 [Legionella taurinensis]PUT46027.1 hypothetical protein DB745_12040 [Legionella taurinensis]